MKRRILMLSMLGLGLAGLVHAQETKGPKAEEVKKENPAAGETFTGRLRKTGSAKTQTAAGRKRKSVEGCEKIGRTRYGISWNEVSRVNSGREEA